MAGEIFPVPLTDWTELDEQLFSALDISRTENFDIHRYNDKLWTSGSVGVGRLFGRNNRPIKNNGKDIVAVIESKYSMEPWVMLEKVMTDIEYEYYQEALKRENKYLYKIFYDQPLIKLSKDDNGSAIVCALSFINSCYYLCKKGLKKQMLYREENFNAKVRGKIDVRKNIRNNTSKGRNDKFYCKFIDFTEDNPENRIIKASLVKAKKALEEKFPDSAEILQRCAFCMNSMRRVKLTRIKASDITNVNAGGLYSYYRPILAQARVILSQKYQKPTAGSGKQANKSTYVVPYMIKMETLFEFYARIVIREKLAGSPYELVPYSEKVFLQKGVTSSDQTEKGTHLMAFCIPDIIIKKNNEVVAVLDAKYKSDSRESRSDSHQLLAYSLLTGTPKCGFVFPSEVTELKKFDGNKEYLEINSPNKSLFYYELLLGNNGISNELDSILK